MTASDPFCRIGLTTPIFGFSHCRGVVAALRKAGGAGVHRARLGSDQEVAMDLKWLENQVGDLPIDLQIPDKSVGSERGGLAGAQAKPATPAGAAAFLNDWTVHHDAPEKAVPGA